MQALIDYSNIMFQPQELVTDVTEGKKHCIDILTEVKINGEVGRVLIHVELQAYRQRNFDRRMFKYFCRLYEKHSKKVLPIAVFLTTVNLSFP